MKKNWIKKLYRAAAAGLAAIMAAGMIPVYALAEETGKAADQMAVISPEAYMEAMKNPLMGLSEKDFFINTTDDEYCLYDQTLDYNPWSTLVMTYIPWDHLENDESDTLEDIAEYCDKRWRGKDANGEWHSYEEYGIKVIPRVYLRFPNDFGTFYGLGGDHWPDDMKAGDLTSAEFDARLERLIQRLGTLWDNDSRVAYIQMGIFGTWGEQHGTGVPEKIGEYFDKYFENKQVQVRYYDEEMWDGYSFGQYNDSIGDLHTDPDKWPYCAIGGEPAYDYGSGVANIHGTCPHVTSMDREYTYNTANMIRKTHSVYLTWAGDYAYGTRWADDGDPHGEGLDYYYQNKTILDQGGEILQKELGYRYVIPEFSYTKETEPGGKLDVSFQVKNVGSAPMYYNWPVQISLRDPETKEIVWSDTFEDVDITEWQPGSGYEDFDKKSGKWSKGVLSYTQEAETNTVEGSFTLPEDLEGGKDYIVQLAVLDPEGGNVPALRFAICNYTKGGYHPMGYVGVGKAPDQTEIDPSEFDDIAVDTSLRYYRTGEATAEPAALESVTVSGEIPVIVYGTEGYDLSGLSIRGTNTDGTVHNLNSAEKTWELESGSEYASVEEGVLVPKAEGSGTVTVTINGIKSSPAEFTVTKDAGTVKGTITGKNNAAIEGAKVVLTLNGASYASAVSDEKGEYTIPSVLSGESYSLTVTKDKYRQAVIKDISVDASGVTKDVALELATAGNYTEEFSSGAEDWSVTPKYGVWEVQDEAYVSIADEASWPSSRWCNTTTLDGRIWDDAVYEVDIKCGEPGIKDENWGAVMFRRSSVGEKSADSGYSLLVRKNGSMDLNAGVGGKYTTLATANGAVSGLTEGYHRIRIVNQGENIKVYVDGAETPVIDVDDSTYSYGYLGLGGNDKGWTYDNISVSTFSEAATKEELKEEIALAKEKLENGTYTDESIEKLSAAVQAGEEIYARDDAAQSEIAEAVQSIRAASDSLVKAYLVSLDWNEEGGTVGDGSTEVKLLKRKYKTFAVIPNEGYYIESILVDGQEIEVTDPQGMAYTVKLILNDVNIKVVFAKDEIPDDEIIKDQDFEADFTQGDDAWIQSGGEWSVSDGTYIQNSTSSEGGAWLYCAAVKGRIWSDAVYEADMHCLDDNGDPTNWASIMFRKSAESDTAADSGYIALVRNNGTVELLKAGKTPETIASAQIEENVLHAETFSEADVHHLKVVTEGNSIQVYYNDIEEPVIDCTDDTYTEGYAGLGTCNSSWKFSNVRISALESGDPTIPEPDKPQKPDTSELEKLIAEAEAIKEEGYSKESYAALQTAIADAKQALAVISSEEELADVIEGLQSAVDSLIRVFHITAVCGAGGTVTPREVFAEQGQNVTFTIIPDEGYEISEVKAGETLLGKVASYTLENVSEDMTITVTFQKKGDIQEEETKDPEDPEEKPEQNPEERPEEDPEERPEKDPEERPEENLEDGNESAQETPGTSDNGSEGSVSKAAKTGDEGNIMIPFATAAAAAAVLVGTVCVKQRKKR